MKQQTGVFRGRFNLRGTLINEILIDKGNVEELEIKETRLMTEAVGFPSSLLLKDMLCYRNPRTRHVCLPNQKGNLGRVLVSPPTELSPRLCLIWSFLISQSPRNYSPGVLSGRREVRVRKG